MDAISHLARRTIEAPIVARFYQQLCRSLDPASALEIVHQVLQGAATEEGQAFARLARPRPSLRHFGEVLGVWDDALTVEPLEQSETVLRFDVVRCRYVEAYRAMGLPPELVRLLSCSRDAPFARGYSDKLEFARVATIADGAERCDFCYRWSG